MLIYMLSVIQKKPRDPRVEGYNTKPGQKADIAMDAGGMVGPEPKSPPWPNGASTFGDVKYAPLSGHYHSIPRGLPMPEGLAVMPDGAEVFGPNSPTHHTIYPTRRMNPQEFIDLFQSLGWQYAGFKP